MRSRWKRWVVTWSLMAAGLPIAAIASATALGIAPGMIDTFEAGASGGWAAGDASLYPPALVATGGPAGAGDGYLALQSAGGFGPSSRLVVIAGPQWAGDYLAAGITRITMDLKNLGNTTLDMRLWLVGPAGASALSRDAFALPAGGGWTRVGFALDTAALTGQVMATLGGVGQLRLYHATAAVFPGEAIVAALGMDNVAAVPEPDARWLMLPGLGAVLARLARRRRR